MTQSVVHYIDSLTHPCRTFQLVCFAAGPSSIMCAGQGKKSPYPPDGIRKLTSFYVTSSQKCPYTWLVTPQEEGSILPPSVASRQIRCPKTTRTHKNRLTKYRSYCKIEQVKNTVGPKMSIRKHDKLKAIFNNVTNNIQSWPYMISFFKLSAKLLDWHHVYQALLGHHHLHLLHHRPLHFLPCHRIQEGNEKD